MKKLINVLKDKYSLFAFIQLIVSIILFITLIYLVIPDVIESIKYLDNVKNTEEGEILGYHVLFHSKPILYLIMFCLQIGYSLYGIIDLIKYQNQRQAFKIMMRSIFYIGGVLVCHYIITFILLLFTPLKNLLTIFGLMYVFIALEVALGGRLASNFTFFSTTLQKRKTIGIVTSSLYLTLCILEMFALLISFEVDTCIFYALEGIIALFALLASIYFEDPLSIKYSKEPKIKEYSVYIPEPNLEITSLSEKQFAKNIKLLNLSIPEGIEKIPNSCFANCLRLKEVYIPKSIIEIGANSFFNNISLEIVIYEGTREEFKKVKLDESSFKKTQIKCIYCSDGPISISYFA